MRITVDTNVLISATFWYGDSNEIINRVERKEFELVLSPEILEEFALVLQSKEIQDKVSNKNLQMKETVQKITSLSALVTPRLRLDIIDDDPSDNKVLECAKAGKADYIISNDNHIMALRKFENIRILSSRQFIDKIRNGYF